MNSLLRRTFGRVLGAVLLVTSLVAVGAGPSGSGILALGRSTTYADSGCTLDSANPAIQHVIYIQFDNVHFTRDNPNVPSDLEQMPHLLNFIKSNGVLLTNHHTPLIAHTADDILTSLTGLYPDQQGQEISNSYRYYEPDGTTNGQSSFTYWTDRLTGKADTSYNLVTHSGNNTPAPWVPYTRAGCNVGAASTADMEMENVGSDLATVFGPNSPQAIEGKQNSDQATADFEGLSIHCAQASSLCSAANGGVPDMLPNEPGGYNGYMTLVGNKYVGPQIGNPAAGDSGTSLHDLFGNVITNADSGLVGFPGFDPTAAQSLAYVADMQEHGVPVTYAYIADAHDNHATGNAYGPGEAGYVAQLKSYDQAFADFFQRLANDGITKANTLFVVTADENDHFAGGPPTPANCDGVTIPCTYSKIGEIDANLPALLASEQNITTPFRIHDDSAPGVWLNGNPARDAAVTRNVERATAQLTASNPITGATDHVTNYLADSVEQNVLHMVTGDPLRTPTFVLFGDPNYYFCGGNYYGSHESWCLGTPLYTSLDSAAWNHGDVAPDINTTWLGMVGPSVRQAGIDSTTWSDESDIRPTMMTILGLQDDYAHEGRTLIEDLDPWAVPPSLRAHRATLLQLGQVYKQINAPVGALGLASLRISTAGIESNSPGDTVYAQTENRLQSIATQRDAIASNMAAMLERAEFGSQPIDEQSARSAIAAAEALLAQVTTLAGSS